MPIYPGMKNEAWLLRPSEAKVCCTAIVKEVEAHWGIHACALEKSHKGSMIELEHEEEGWDHQTFLEAYGPVHLKPVGYLCIPCSSLPVMCH